MGVDIKDLLRKIDLRALAEEAGAQFSPSGSSRCPLHLGDNRQAFHVYTTDEGLSRWHCFTNCAEGENDGSAIDFYMRWRNVDTKTAIGALAQRAGVEAVRGARPVAAAEPRSLIRETATPAATWSARAEQFAAFAVRQLWSEAGRGALAYLREARGLNDDTIRAHELGFNPKDLFDAPARWGSTDDRPVLCARGIVIPHRTLGGAIGFINVRRPQPGDGLAKRIGASALTNDAKYLGPREGRRGLYGIHALRGMPVLLLVEGEFDRMLAWQCVGDVADVATLGPARQQVDVAAAVVMLRAAAIVGVLDADAAGDKGRDYLRQVSPRIQIVAPPDHDLTDYWTRGGDLRAWLGGLVAGQMERLIGTLDARAQPDVYAAWLEVSARARAAANASPPTSPAAPPIALSPLATLPMSGTFDDLADLCDRHGVRVTRMWWPDKNGPVYAAFEAR